MNWIDENPNALNDFTMWITSTLTKNSVLNESDGSGDNSTVKKN